MVGSEGDVVANAIRPPRDPSQPLVELRGVNKHFGQLHVLRDINLTVAPGEVLVVIGPSGSDAPPRNKSDSSCGCAASGRSARSVG